MCFSVYYCSCLRLILSIIYLTITRRQAELRDVTLVLNSNLVNLLSTEQAPAYLTPDFIYSNNTVV